MATYRAFWGTRSGATLEALYDFLTWKKEDWMSFEKLLDRLERAKPTKKIKATRIQWVGTVHSLRSRNAIIFKKIGDRVVVKLSEKGWRAVQVRRLRHVRKMCPAGLCIVIFDFPESEHHARDMFRRFLWDAGFGRLQKSVFVCPRDVGETLSEVIDDMGIWSWVAVLEGCLKRGKIEYENIKKDAKPIKHDR